MINWIRRKIPSFHNEEPGFNRWLAEQPSGLVTFVIWLLGGMLMTMPESFQLSGYDVEAFGLWLTISAGLLHLESIDSAISMLLEDSRLQADKEGDLEDG